MRLPIAVSLVLPMWASAKPGIPSKVDNDGSQIGNKLDRQLIMASSPSVPVAKTFTGDKDVSCLPSYWISSPFSLVSVLDMLFWYLYLIMLPITEHWLSHWKCIRHGHGKVPEIIQDRSTDNCLPMSISSCFTRSMWDSTGSLPEWRRYNRRMY